MANETKPYDPDADTTLAVVDRAQYKFLAHMGEHGMEPGPEYEWGCGREAMVSLYWQGEAGRGPVKLDEEGRLRSLFGVRVRFDPSLDPMAIVLRRRS